VGITLPTELADIADKVGVQWPRADETAMHAAAQAWRTAAQKLTTLAKDADTTATQALGAMTGAAADKAGALWEKFVHGENGHVTQAVQGCVAAADRLEQAATKIGAAKVEIVRELTALSQHSDAVDATQSDLAKSQLGMLTLGASNDINCILSDLTGAVNPRALQVPEVSADGQTVVNADGTVTTDLRRATAMNGQPTTQPGQQPPLLPGITPPDNSADVTGPVPRHVIAAAQPQRHYYQDTPPPPVHNSGGGGYSAPQPSYSDPSPPTGPIHVPQAHVPQSTTVESAAPPPVVSAPVHNPQPPVYQQPADGGLWTSSLGDAPPPGATDVPATYGDPRSVAPAKHVIRRPGSSPGLFMVYMFPIGHMPVPSARPAGQLPPPPTEVDYAAGLRFVPHDHPKSDLMESVGPGRVELPGPLSGEESGVTEGYDPLGGEHERDWDRRFLVRAGDEERRGEYAWPPGELFPEGGCDDGEAVVLEPGEVLDRFGTPEGRVFSAEGTPFAQRSLPPEHLDAGYRRYRVLKPLPVWRTISAAWFGQTGGGVRYRAVYPAADLVALGFVEAVA
jgi:Tuberculosis necrotizing toxin